MEKYIFIMLYKLVRIYRIRNIATYFFSYSSIYMRAR